MVEQAAGLQNAFLLDILATFFTSQLHAAAPRYAFLGCAEQLLSMLSRYLLYIKALQT